MFCPKCGNPLSEGAAFCSKCGHQIPRVQAAPSRYEAPQYQAPQYQTPQYQAPQYQAPQYHAAPLNTAAGPDISPKVKTLIVVFAALALLFSVLGRALWGSYITSIFQYGILTYGTFLVSMILMNRKPAVIALLPWIIMSIQDIRELPYYIEDKDIASVVFVLLSLAFVILFALELVQRKKVFRILAIVLAALFAGHAIGYHFNFQIIQRIFGSEQSVQNKFGSLCFFLFMLFREAASLLLVTGIRCDEAARSQAATGRNGLSAFGKPAAYSSIALKIVFILLGCTFVLEIAGYEAFVAGFDFVFAEFMDYMVRDVLLPYGLLFAGILLARRYSAKLLLIPLGYLAVEPCLSIINEFELLIRMGFEMDAWWVITAFGFLAFYILFMLMICTEKRFLGYIALGTLAAAVSRSLYYGIRSIYAGFYLYDESLVLYILDMFRSSWFCLLLFGAVLVILVLAFRTEKGRENGTVKW